MIATLCLIFSTSANLIRFFIILFQFANLDRKIIELYDDLMSQVTNLPAAKGNRRKWMYPAMNLLCQ